jgi:hypothetical protein
MPDAVERHDGLAGAGAAGHSRGPAVAARDERGLGGVQEDLPGAEVTVVDDRSDVVVHGRDGGARHGRGQVGGVGELHHDGRGDLCSDLLSAHAGREPVEDVLAQQRGVGHELIELGAVGDGQRQLDQRFGHPESA